MKRVVMLNLALVAALALAAWVAFSLSNSAGREFVDIEDAEKKLSLLGLTCTPLYETSHRLLVVSDHALSRDEAVQHSINAYRFRGRKENLGIVVIVNSRVNSDGDEKNVRKFGPLIAFGDPEILDKIESR